MQRALSGIVSGIEGMLSSYYVFSPVSSAAPFLINDESLAALAKEKNLNSKDFSPTRGSVLLLDEGGDEGMFICLLASISRTTSFRRSKSAIHCMC